MATTWSDLRWGMATPTPRISTALKAPLLIPHDDDERPAALRGMKEEASLESRRAPERAVPQVAAMVVECELPVAIPVVWICGAIGEAELEIELQMLAGPTKGIRRPAALPR